MVMKKALRIVSLIIVIPVLLFIIFLIYSTLVDYKPKPIEVLAESPGKVVSVYDTIRILNWNIGYCGLGNDMSFFYDGGDQVRTTKQRTVENLSSIVNFINKKDSIDFYLLQEVDKKSRRSYKLNQYDSIGSILPGFNQAFSLNYKVAFVPVPPSNPLGGVEGGLATFSKYEPFKVARYAFPGNYAWPKGLFLLDRCFMVHRFFTSNGKELIIVNTHNSAYDDGSLRKKQMTVMKEFLLAEYEKGNYIVVGGDWNQNAPSNTNEPFDEKQGRLTRVRIDADYMPQGWQWHFCDSIPTNRLIDEVYNPKTTITTTIDFYLVSPNVLVTQHKNIDLDFKNSDHQPVLLNFTFVR